MQILGEVNQTLRFKT